MTMDTLGLSATEKLVLKYSYISSKEEMITMMKTCLVKQGTADDDSDEGVKDLIEMTLRKMDHDKDGRVSFGDFQITVKNDPLMMEAFGPCLPNSALGRKGSLKVEMQEMKTFSLLQTSLINIFLSRL